MLNLGAGGTGKSHALRTVLDVPEMEVAAIFTEPSGMETLSDTDPERFHWVYVPPAKADWGMLGAAAKTINTMSFKALTEMGDIEKRKFPQWMDFVSACGNYVCQRCGKQLGAIDDLPLNVVVAIDSLSGLNEMAMNLVVGMKPVRSPGDWGTAMNNLEKWITTFATAVPGMAILTGHLEREQDEVSGNVQLMASTLGKKLAPKVGRFFSDIIMSRREGEKFEWSTGAFNVDLKARNVPISDHIPPSYAPIIRKWHARIKKA